MANWQMRYFVLDIEEKTLKYFTAADKTDEKGSFSLLSGTLSKEQQTATTYSICLRGTTFGKGDAELIMTCDFEDQRDYWFKAIEEAIYGTPINEQDICESFNSHVRVKLGYPKRLFSGLPLQVGYGEDVTAAAAADEPSVTYSIPYNKKDDFFTILLTDPDWPSQSAPSQKELILWLVVNVPGNIVSKGETILPYLPPCPTCNSGAHRYILL